MKLWCILFDHDPESHLDYIWGNLPREHQVCKKCGMTVKFERPLKEREDELLELGDVRDGDVRGCKPI